MPVTIVRDSPTALPFMADLSLGKRLKGYKSCLSIISGCPSACTSFLGLLTKGCEQMGIVRTRHTIVLFINDLHFGIMPFFLQHFLSSTI